MPKPEQDKSFGIFILWDEGNIRLKNEAQLRYLFHNLWDEVNIRLKNKHNRDISSTKNGLCVEV